jgi:transposase
MYILSEMVQLNVSFKDHIRRFILNNNLFKPTTNTKYTLDQILDVIEYVLITGASWRSIDLPIFNELNIRWQSIYYHFQKFSKANVFKKVYLQLLDVYFKQNRSGKLKYLSVDTSFVRNQCSKHVAFNGYYKKKRLSKLSMIVDSNGVPISALITEGNHNDQKLFHRNWKNLFVEITSTNNNNKHKRYLLADAIYDAELVRQSAIDKNITPIIWKRKYKGRSIQLSKNHKQIFKRRIVIENCFSWIYQNQRTYKRFDKSNQSYLSFLFMAFSRIILRRI